MRIRGVGYEGARPPVPGTTPVVPEDPGPDPVPSSGDIPEPLTVIFSNGDVFHKLNYLALGYNRFDVMCIGAGGGCGGGFNWHRGGDGSRWIYGGAGGGGGAHRIKGRLALLPTACPVVVGSPGVSVPFITDGSGGAGVGSPSGVGGLTGYQPGAYAAAAAATDGGYSSFGGATCRASGGKGGKKGYYIPGVVGGGAKAGFGGEGGLGNVITPGGGGGAEPTWNGVIGKGGNGGAGGVRLYYDNPLNGADPWTFHGANADYAQYPGNEGATADANAVSSMNGSAGSRGSYSTSDSSISAGGGARRIQEIYRVLRDTSIGAYYPGYDEAPIIPGPGGGARTFPIDGSLAEFGLGAGMYGTFPDGGHLIPAGQGWVVIRLTYLSL